MALARFFEIYDRPAVRLERTFDRPIDAVWSAVTDPAQLASWFPSSVELELRVGGTVAFAGDPNVADSTGTVVACEPPHRISFTWGENELRFALEALSDASTRFVLVDVLAARTDAARNAAGWTVCLEELTKHLTGIASGGPRSDDAISWQDSYDEHVAAGLPSGSPITAHR